MEQKFRLLLRSIVVRPAKKFTLGLVTDILPYVKSKESLDDLLQSGYFKVVWSFFHADVTNNHLKLILLVAYYELDFCNEASCLHSMTSDKSKIQDLVVRVLQATMDTSADSTALRGAAFLFLGALVRFDASVLRGSKLYAKWSENILEHHLNALSTLERPEYPGYTRCFVYFCICWAVSDEVVKTKVTNLQVSLYFTGPGMGEALTMRLGDLLSLVCYEEADFVSIQLIFQNYGSTFDFLVMAFSRLDVPHAELAEALETLEPKQLDSVATSLNIEAKLSRVPLIESIVVKVLGPRITRSTCFQISKFTEIDLFDLFDYAYPELVTVPLIPYTLKLEESHFLSSEQLRLAWSILSQIHEHLMSTLGRLTITDGTKEEGIQGKSKYFYRLQSATFTGRYGTLTTKTPLNTISDTVILLDVHRRNDHDERFRIKKHGIRAALVARVISSGNKEVKVHVDGIGEHTYNGFISLPETISVKGLNELTEAAKSLRGSHIFDLGETTDDCSTEVVNLDMDVVKAIEGVEFESKKDGRQFKYRSKNFHSTAANSMLNGPESQALLTMLTSKILVIRAASNSGRSCLTNCFLETLQRNWPAERCLVVLPSRLAVGHFRCFPDLASVVKVGDPHYVNGVFDRRKQLLEKVSGISKLLDLHEYAFDTSVVNALMLFQAHIVPKWDAFLSQLQKSKESIARYPFKNFHVSDDADYEKMLTDVLDHYADIKKTFADLQRLLALDKVDCKDTRTVEEFFAKTSKYTVCSIDDLDPLQKYDNIVSFSSLPQVLIPILKGSKRTIFFTPEKFAGLVRLAETLSAPSAPLPTVGVRSEIAALTGRSSSVTSQYNPGLKYTVQHIKVTESKGQVNIEEARYIVYLYQYFRLLGYPHSQLLVIVASPYMKVLIEEILEESNISKDDEPSDEAVGFKFGWPLIQSSKGQFSCDYAIVLSHPSLSMREYVEVAESARLGIYIVGSSLSAPYKIKLGELEVYTGAQFALGKDFRGQSEAYEMEGADHMGEYVEQMTRTRMGRGSERR